MMEALIIIMVVVMLYLIGVRMSKQDNRVRDDELIKLTDMLDDIHMEYPYKIEPKAVKKKTSKKVKKAVKKVSPKKKVVKKKVVPKKKVVKKKIKTKRKTK